MGALKVLNMEITYVYCGMEELDAATDPNLQAALSVLNPLFIYNIQM